MDPRKNLRRTIIVAVVVDALLALFLAGVCIGAWHGLVAEIEDSMASRLLLAMLVTLSFSFIPMMLGIYLCDGIIDDREWGDDGRDWRRPRRPKPDRPSFRSRARPLRIHSIGRRIRPAPVRTASTVPLRE